MNRLAFIGGGGFAKEVQEIAQLVGHEVVGYCADTRGVIDRPYWGPKDALLSHRAEFDAVCVAFGAVDSRTMLTRREVTRWLTALGLPAATLISPHALVSTGATIGAGSIIGHRATVGIDARLGRYTIINIGAIVGHDAVIGDDSMIAPRAFIGGSAVLGDNVFVGPGANVLHGLQIGSDAVVGVGVSVLRNVPSAATVWPVRSKMMEGGAMLPRKTT